MEKVEKVGSQAEYDQARVVLVHTPNIEYKLGMLAPSAALFEGFGDYATAKQEHHQFILELRRREIDVYNVVDVLLDGTTDEKGEIVEGESIRILRELASYSMFYSFNDLNIETKRKLNLERQTVLELAKPRELVQMILQQPQVIISPTPINTYVESTITLKPLYNLMFLKDQMITTDKGVVLGKMNSSQRASEVEIIKVVLQKMGIQPIYQIENGVLEGGDFIPCGKNKDNKTFAMIGQGLRTNDTALDEVITRNGKDLFGYDYIAVVKDVEKSIDEMHLDTYFNVFAPLKAAVLETRVASGEDVSEKKIPKVDIYEKTSNGKYRLIEKELEFRNFLAKTGFEVIPLTENMQRKYGCNFLTIAPNHIIGVDISAKADYEAKLKGIEDRLKGLNTDSSAMIKRYYQQLGMQYRSHLASHGINGFGLKLMPFTHLNKAYGGPHCLTQVLYRESQK